ncbi:YutD family protein [Bacillus nitroreducens]
MITINNSTYELVDELKGGFNEEAFRARYSDILAKYDYIVGDWGYEQLRLKGFFDDKNQKASFDTKISTLSEYLYEYCNFGCAYFVLKKVKK